MNQQSKAISTLSSLGDYILSQPEELKEIITIAKHHNGWFDQKNCELALNSIANEYLNKNKLTEFASSYKFKNANKKTIGLILAGNIPLVGFHDILCVLLSGHKAKIKLSSKDDKLMKALLIKLQSINDQFKEQIEFVERLTDFDAVIATGSNNSARYFEEYFGKYPNIIRKNRTSIAVLTGDETKEDFIQLGKDIFQYYGLGCRNVSKLFVPKEYDFTPFLDAMKHFKDALNNQKYNNNFDYNLSLFLLNKIPFLQGDAILITENKALSSRIAVLHSQTYENKDEVINYIIDNKEKLQVIIGKEFTPFGLAQIPGLSDFADNVDTMKFLSEL